MDLNTILGLIVTLITAYLTWITHTKVLPAVNGNTTAINNQNTTIPQAIGGLNA